MATKFETIRSLSEFRERYMPRRAAELGEPTQEQRADRMGRIMATLVADIRRARNEVGQRRR